MGENKTILLQGTLDLLILKAIGVFQFRGIKSSPSISACLDGSIL
ncbi:hypothetical protein [Tunturiibacter lichenicola]